MQPRPSCAWHADVSRRKCRVCRENILLVTLLAHFRDTYVTVPGTEGGRLHQKTLQMPEFCGRREDMAEARADMSAGFADV